MRVTYQDKELYESIEFIALGLGETAIHLEHEQENLDIIFDFKKSAIPNKPTDLKMEVVNSSTFKITCIDWSEPFATTLPEVLEIGTYISRKLYIIFGVSKIGTLAEFRKVNLSVYLGERVCDDQA